MKPHRSNPWLFIPAAAVFILAIGWPTAALIGRAAAEGASPTGVFTDGCMVTRRQLLLLWSSVRLSGLAAGLALFVSLPAVYVFGELGGFARRPRMMAALSAIIMCPPMVQAFAWQQVSPVAFGPRLRCLAVWTLWAWPIPALIMGDGWCKARDIVREPALLDASKVQIFLRMVLPSLRTPIASSALILFVLFLGGYELPHACGLTVYATELLGWAASSTRAMDTIRPALPSLAVILLALLALYAIWKRQDKMMSPQGIENGTFTERSAARNHALITVLIVGFVLSWFVPVGLLIVRLDSWAVFMRALQTYGRDLIWSIGTASIAGSLAIGMGIGVGAHPGRRRFVLGWAVLFGALPGAVVGQALIAAYNHTVTSALYDHWPIIVLGFTARFGWIGMTVAMLATGRHQSILTEQARTDGASEGRILARIIWPLSWRILLGGAGITAVLSLGDVAVVSMVRTPRFSPISLVIIEKFHRFEDGMLVSLSLSLVAIGLIGVSLVMWSVSRRSQFAGARGTNGIRRGAV